MTALLILAVFDLALLLLDGQLDKAIPPAADFYGPAPMFDDLYGV